LAPSVKTLTAGSQATIGLRTTGLAGEDAVEGFAAATGMRTRKVVSKTPVS